MVLWWKPQVCPGSPLAQGIFNLARNLKTVYELSGHISRHFWDQQRSPIQGRFSGTFDSIFDGLVFCFLFFFFEMKKRFSGGWCWLSVCPAPLCGSPLHPQLPVKQSGERKAQEQELWGLPSPGVQWSSPPNAPDLVHLLFLISAARIVYLATLLLIFFF